MGTKMVPVGLGSGHQQHLLHVSLSCQWHITLEGSL